MRPKEPWIRACLLFQDRVLTIVPEVHAGLDWLSSDTRKILDKIESEIGSPPDRYLLGAKQESGVLIQIDPHAQIYNTFEDVFLEEIDSYYRVNEDAFEWDQSSTNNYYSMAENKLPTKVQNWLHERRLFVSVITDPDRMGVQPNIGNFIMNRLAAEVSQHCGVPSATDVVRDFACNALRGIRPSNSDDADIRLLSWSLPVIVPPGLEDLSPAEFLDVRKRYQELATSVRWLMGQEARSQNVHQAQDLQMFYERLDAAKAEVEERIREFRVKISRFDADKYDQLALAGLVEVGKMVPLIGPAISLIERLVAEARREQPLPLDPIRATYCNLASIHQHVETVTKSVKLQLMA